LLNPARSSLCLLFFPVLFEGSRQPGCAIPRSENHLSARHRAIGVPEVDRWGKRIVECCGIMTCIT
jgi:hypothetical protein